MEPDMREHAVIIDSTTVTVKGAPRQSPTTWSMLVDDAEVDTAEGVRPTMRAALTDGSEVQARVIPGQNGADRLAFSHDGNEVAVYSLAD